jgi:hypothetical protein
MAESTGVVRQFAWRELFPWLILFRTFKIAISPGLLALATVAVLVAPIGWNVAGRVFLTPTELQAQSPDSRLLASVPPAVLSWLPPQLRATALDKWFDLSEPLVRFFSLDLSLRESAYYAFGFLWMLALWSFPGGVITRKAIVQLATDEPASVASAATYAGPRYFRYFLAPLYPVLVLVALACPIAALGWIIYLLSDFGVLVAGLLWLLVAIAGVGALWLFGGLLFGWPLMWPTISAERDGDPFEAFSRSYSYVFGRPLHYFFYVVVAAAFGALCWAVVWAAMLLVQEFGFWALSWGAGGEATADIRMQALDYAIDGEANWLNDRSLWNSGTALIGAIVVLLHTVAAAFRYTFLFSVASAIYLLLRHDVDEKEMDEVYLETSPADATRPATIAAKHMDAPSPAPLVEETDARD